MALSSCKFVGCNLDHVVATVAQPGADLAVAFRGLGIAVQLATQPVKVDAYALVGIMVLGSIDHVGCRCTKRPAQPDLLPTDPFAEPRGAQQVTQPRFRVVHRQSVVTWLVGNVHRRNLVPERETCSPLIEPCAGGSPIQMSMVVGVAKRLQAVDA